MNKKDVLILLETPNPNDDIFFNDWKANGYNADVVFKKIPKPIRAIRRICLIYNIGDLSIWLGKWYDNLSQYKSIIIHMNRLTRHLPELISKKNKTIKVITWYWNTINKDSEPIKTDNQNIEYYSFDKNDCSKYGLKYNIQYYCPIKVDNTIKKTSDIYFIGRDKGRKELIKHIEEEAKKQGLVCNFNIINDSSNDIKPYSEVKKDLLTTKSILDINKDNQIGFTLRVLESLYYGIKLITNNKDIINSKLYNKNNIFIIGIDKMVLLKEFIDAEYDTKSDIFKDDYSLDTWFHNFYNDH